jgi:capsular polysaccharide biosynthesis protein
MSVPGYRPAYPLLTPLIESWRQIVIVAVIVAVATFAFRYFLVERRYEARATLMTVNSSRALGTVGGLAALSALTGQQGSNTPPELVARVLVARQVLTRVGLSPVDEGSETRLIDRLAGETRADISVPNVPRELTRVVNVSIDRETGLLDVAVKSADSALARLLVTRIIEFGGEAFNSVMRAQGSAQRAGQEARVALRAEQLRDAERRRLEFMRTHRALTPFSTSAVEQMEWDREVELARQAYTEAITAREAAFARELEQTPAVVIVDPVPDALPSAPRYNLFYAMALGILAAFVVATLALVRDRLRAMRDAEDPRAQRFVAALGRVPGFGRLARMP